MNAPLRGLASLLGVMVVMRAYVLFGPPGHDHQTAIAVSNLLRSLLLLGGAALIVSEQRHAVLKGRGLEPRRTLLTLGAGTLPSLLWGTLSLNTAGLGAFMAAAVLMTFTLIFRQYRQLNPVTFGE